MNILSHPPRDYVSTYPAPFIRKVPSAQLTLWAVMLIGSGGFLTGAGYCLVQAWKALAG